MPLSALLDTSSSNPKGPDIFKGLHWVLILCQMLQNPIKGKGGTGVPGGSQPNAVQIATFNISWKWI